MRKIFSVMMLLAIAGGGLWLSRNYHVLSFNDASLAARTESVKDQPVVLGTQSVVSHEEPVEFESRESAAQFLPERKPGSGDLAVPNAHAAAIIDADSGKVLFAANGDVHRQIASLTKLMTTTMAVERIKNLDEPVAIDEEAIYADGTRVGCPRSGFCNGNRLKPGEQVSVYNLLKAALMNSANDSAIALGKHMGGTQDGFAGMMNTRAQQLGLQNTHFCTPSGLEPDGREKECYSSALDIARIGVQALKYDVLWQIMRLPDATITSIDGKQSHDIFNTDKLLGQMPNLIGTKTGFTPLAGYSLFAAAWDPTHKHRVVAVVLDDSARFQDIQMMFDWTFRSYTWK